MSGRSGMDETEDTKEQMTDLAQPIPVGDWGIDCNVPLSAASCRLLRQKGYTFALRYVPRDHWREGDLTAAEVTKILDNGLGVMPVQHVDKGRWMPSEALGYQYGKVAVKEAQACGIVEGTSLWLDLEAVHDMATTREVDIYCRAWHYEVKSAGYLPGLYVGWEPGLGPVGLWRLPFTRYWSAYNLNLDQYPWLVGVCMKQKVARPQDSEGFSFELDNDLVVGDKNGRVPMVHTREGW